MKFYYLALVLAIAVGITGCGPNSESVSYSESPGSAGPVGFSEIKPYSRSSLYAQSLSDCIGESVNQYSCSLTQLPFLGMEEGFVSNADIQGRLMVSHTWMGDRFMSALKHFPDEAKQLFGAVTAIVIASDIRPSFYLKESGAIYIDPDYLWLTNEEKRTISTIEDFRSGFGDELSLLVASRSVKNDEYASQFYSLEDAGERTMQDIIYPLMSVLFHELAHANDFFPADKMASANPEHTAHEAINALENYVPADTLYGDSALMSEELSELGEVLFSGTQASYEQRTLTADYAGALFANDGANHMYNYSNRHEDLAMLLEAVLMKRYFDIDLDIAFLHRPSSSEDATCADYIVGWGERNRIANPLVINRAQTVAQLLLPELAWEEFFQTGIGQHSSMTFGESWCDNLALESRALRGVDRTTEVGNEQIRASDFMPPYVHSY